jgi:hypothetical protein
MYLCIVSLCPDVKIISVLHLLGARGGVVVKALRGFDSPWCHWNFSVTILPVALWPWGQLSLYQKWVPGVFPGGKGGRCVRLTTLPPFCAVVMKSGSLNFLEPSGPLQACNGTSLPFLLHLVLVVHGAKQVKKYICRYFMNDPAETVIFGDNCNIYIKDCCFIWSSPSRLHGVKAQEASNINFCCWLRLTHSAAQWNGP